jgi:hypothetical protein
MSYQELESREYKVMLDPTRFGDPSTLPSGAAAFWADLQERLPNISVLTAADEEWKPASAREVTFWDTTDGALYRHDFVLRLRQDSGQGRVTLKKRTPDRVLASYNGIDKTAGEHAGFDLRRKFEEDIKLSDDARMRSLFSHSLDWRDPPAGIDLAVVDIVEHVFPGFGRAVDADSEQLRRLGGITIAEHVVELPDVELGGKPAEVALVAWYRAHDDLPSVVEASYRYEGDEHDFDPVVAANAVLVLDALANLLEWRPPEDQRITKTSWIYREAGITL